MLHQPMTGQIRLLSDAGSALGRLCRPGHSISRVSLFFFFFPAYPIVKEKDHALQTYDRPNSPVVRPRVCPRPYSAVPVTA